MLAEAAFPLGRRVAAAKQERRKVLDDDEILAHEHVRVLVRGSLVMKATTPCTGAIIAALGAGPAAREAPLQASIAGRQQAASRRKKPRLWRERIGLKY